MNGVCKALCSKLHVDGRLLFWHCGLSTTMANQCPKFLPLSKITFIYPKEMENLKNALAWRIFKYQSAESATINATATWLDADCLLKFNSMQWSQWYWQFHVDVVTMMAYCLANNTVKKFCLRKFVDNPQKAQFGWRRKELEKEGVWRRLWERKYQIHSEGKGKEEGKEKAEKI